MRFRGFLLIGSALSAAALTLLACGGSGTLKAPTSDSQSDDPCDPGGGGLEAPPPPVDGGSRLISLPSGAPGIGFEDLRFSGTLGRLLVPGGRSGTLDLLDPSTGMIVAVGGFASAPTYDGQPDVGVVSADDGNSIVYAVDRTNKLLDVVDAKKGAIVSSAATASTPALVRYVPTTNEIWVTEPDQARIEVFTPGGADGGGPAHSMFIAIPNGPVSLVVDADNKRVFTQGTSTTVRIDPQSHAVTATWPNSCAQSSGMDLDSARGWVFSACAEGRVLVLDANNGSTVGAVSVGGGVDQVTYDAERMRLYVPSTADSAMTVVGLSTTAPPAALGSIDTPSDSHCAVSIGGGTVYVCSPRQGGLLLVRDPF
jgi:DNA-binding beta-propeller fold protein YncE